MAVPHRKVPQPAPAVDRGAPHARDRARRARGAHARRRGRARRGLRRRRRAHRGARRAGSSSPAWASRAISPARSASTLASTGTPAYYVHPGEASHGDLGMIHPDDAILALSWSGETTELSDLIAYAKRFRVPVVGMTSKPASTLGRQADVCLAVPEAKEACPNGLAPTTSTTMQLALGDALAVALLERRGFTARDFRVFHPGGKLGAQLRLVRDVMHAGERPADRRDRRDDAGGDRRDQRQGLRQRHRRERRRHARRHRHRRRSAPEPAPRAADPAGDGDHDAQAAHHRPGRARREGARDAGDGEDHLSRRRRGRRGRSGSCISSTCCAPARREAARRGSQRSR